MVKSSIIPCSDLFIYSSELKMLFSNLTLLFLENRNDSFELFFSCHPHVSGYFMTMKWRSQRCFICLPCALLCGVQARKNFCFVIILNHRNFCFNSRLALPFIIFLYVILSVPRPAKSFWMTDYFSGRFFLLLMKFFLVLK